MTEQRARIADLCPGEVEQGNVVSFLRLRDPDADVMVLASGG